MIKKYLYIVAIIGLVLFNSLKSMSFSSLMFGNKLITIKSVNQNFKKANKNLIPTDTTFEDKEALKQAIFNKRLWLEALRKGYDKDPEYIDELKSYKNTLAEGYLIDSATIKNLLSETYTRMHHEIRASQIMLNLSEYADPQDTLAVYNKILALRQKILAGEDFHDMARVYSEDKKTSTLGGDLGWFTALQLIYPIENIAYSTAVNAVSMPFRTKGGYHLLKVYDKRPYSGEVQVQHLMKIVPKNVSDSLKIKATIDSLYSLLKAGANFDILCKKYSDDKSTKNIGGLLLKFKVGTREDSFENAAFALKNDGEISKPIRTEAGWHILKLVKKYPLDNYNVLLPKLKDKIITDSRGEIVKSNSLKQIKKQLLFYENAAIIKSAINRADSNLLLKKWRYTLSDSLLMKPIFSFDKQSFTTQSFFDFVIDKQKFFKVFSGATPQMLMRMYYSNYVNNTLKQYAEDHLEEKNADFKTLMDEYKVSILNTRLINERVYDKSVADTLAQRAYYERNIQKYSMPESVYASIISTNDVKYFQQIREILAKGTPFQLKRGILPIYFDKLVAELNPEAKKQLISLLFIMRKQPNYIVEIAAHASAIETENVSSDRLKKVVDFLTTNGLPITRIIENNLMKSKSIASNDEAKNQNVSFQFFSNSKEDLNKTLNARNSDAVQIKEAYFKRGDNAYLDEISWTPGIHLLDKDNRKIEINIQKVEPKRYKTLKEVRGEVIKGYQEELEKAYRAELAQRFPNISLSDFEIKQLWNK